MITAIMRLAQHDVEVIRHLNHRVWFNVVELIPAPQRKRQSTGETQGNEWPVVHITASQPPATLKQRCSGLSCRLAAISA